MKKPYLFLSLLIFILLIQGCTRDQEQELTQILLYDSSSYFYLDTRNYPEGEAALPIGIFDSGTGGLAVMEVILNLDKFDNHHSQGIGHRGAPPFPK